MSNLSPSTLPPNGGSWHDMAEDLLSRFPKLDRAELLKDVVAHCFFDRRYGTKREEWAACDMLNEIQRMAIKSLTGTSPKESQEDAKEKL